ncbi:hypothetical protein ACIO3R_38655 [Streptomyces sp. NPDC087428]|uniref:hypothetical protein n=1 Tax=Streptomyces sp. NPDC087428 TaxID=3365788 RepID=UPI00381247A6
MAADLQTRYLTASDTWRAHRKGCEPCTSLDAGQHCPAGAPLREQFVRLQDAYLTHLRRT